jgi:hypothetical protein
MRRLHRWALPLFAGLFVASAAPSALAQSDADRATARELGKEGQDALDKKDYKTAEDRFKRADALFHAPTLLLGYARAEAGLGKVVNASESYNRIVREGVAPGGPAAFVAAVESAKAEVGAVTARIASVTITVTGPENPKVTLDDIVVPVAALGVRRPVDPGAHVVRASADGYDPGETKFTVADAASANAALTLNKSALAAAAAPPPTGAPADTGAQPATPPAGDTGAAPSGGSPLRTVGLVGMGVGAAGLAVGAITGFMAMGKHSDLSDKCPNGKCSSDVQSDVDSYHSMATISTIGFIAGGVLAAGGAVLFFTAPKASSAPAQTGGFIAPYVGPGSLGAVGRF